MRRGRNRRRRASEGTIAAFQGLGCMIVSGDRCTTQAWFQAFMPRVAPPDSRCGGKSGSGRCLPQAPSRSRDEWWSVDEARACHLRIADDCPSFSLRTQRHLTLSAAFPFPSIAQTPRIHAGTVRSTSIGYWQTSLFCRLILPYHSPIHRLLLLALSLLT